MHLNQVMIIGGGIGGLAAAIALRNRGIACEVYERAPEFREVGAGVNLTPNGVKACFKLSEEIGQAVCRVGAEADPVYPFPWLMPNGKVSMTHAFGDMRARWGAPMVSIHRADLHGILLRALPASALHTGRTVADLAQDDSGITATFEGGARARGEVLIGADGVHSTVRTRLFGTRPAHYAGCTSIRGVAPLPDHPYTRPGGGFLTSGAGIQLFVLAIDAQRLYWVATIKAPQGEVPRLSQNDARQFLLDRVAGWHEPVEAMIRSTTSLVLTDIHEGDELASWSCGRAVLLGDAAHAMSPFMGQGANMALEDAVRLADCLADEPTFASAFTHYEATRKPRTMKMVKQSRQMGQVGMMANPVGVWLRDRVMMPLMTKLVNQDKANEDLYGYAP